MKKIDYRVTEDIYNMIINGTKRVEIRLSNEKSNNIEAGNEIRFYVLDSEKYFDVMVKKVYKFGNVQDLLKEISMSLIMNKDTTKEMLENKLYSIYSKEDIDKNGLVGIEFMLKDNPNYETEMAIAETNKEEYKKSKTYDSVDELFEELKK